MKQYFSVQGSNADGTWETLYFRRVQHADDEAKHIRWANIAMKALKRCEPERDFRIVERTIETVCDVLVVTPKTRSK